MNAVVCPHCGAHRVVAAKVPHDVVLILPCPACHELVILFRGQTIALSRKIIRTGATEECRNHIADIVMQFLERGLFLMDPTDAPDDGEAPAQAPSGRRRRTAESTAPGPITQEEVERFLRVDLKCIDDAAYFRKYFG